MNENQPTMDSVIKENHINAFVKSTGEKNHLHVSL